MTGLSLDRRLLSSPLPGILMHRYTAPQRLPVELLLLIFERASGRFSSSVNLDAVVRPAAHAPLVACALVCRSWARAAQRVLFRDLVLSRADYGRDGTPAPGIGPALRALAQTLAARPALAEAVDFLHVDVGRPAQLGAGADDACLTDIAALIARCARVRHVSLTLESTPRGPVFCAADVELLRHASASVRHLTYTDFRPLCDAETGNLPAEEGSEASSDLASNALLEQCLSVWPHVSLLSFCGTYPDADPTDDGSLANSAISTTLREIRGYGGSVLPSLHVPLLERLEWVGLPAAKLETLPAGIKDLTLWQVNESLHLDRFHALGRLALDVCSDLAWATLSHLPLDLAHLVVYGWDGLAAKNALLEAITRLPILQQVVLARRRNRGPREPLSDEQLEGYGAVAKTCEKRDIRLSRVSEDAYAPWDIIPRP